MPHCPATRVSFVAIATGRYPMQSSSGAMDALFERPLVRQVPRPGPGIESASTGGATMMHTNPFCFDRGIAPPYPYSTASASASASSWSSFSGGDMGRRIHHFSVGRDLARAPISMSDLCDDYFPRPAQFGPSPTMNVPDNYFAPAVGGGLPTLPLPVPPAGFNPAPVVYDYGNPFDADGRATTAMEIPAPWDPRYDGLVQPGVEEPAVPAWFASPACDCDGGTLNDDNSTLLCCLYDGFDEDIEATLRTQEDEDEAKPSPDYLETTQGGRMSQDTRATLVGWMNMFTDCYELAPGTLHRAVSYVDRFLSVRPLADVGMRRLRVLGAVAVYAAAKYEDQGTVEKLDAAEVLDMERALLAALDYRLGRPTAYTFVEHFTRHYGQEEEGRRIRSCAHDFAEMSLLHYGCLQHSPSAVAAAAMFLGRLALKPTYGQMKRWNRELKELTGYEAIKLERCVEAIHSIIPRLGDGFYDDIDLFPMLYAI